MLDLGRRRAQAEIGEGKLLLELVDFGPFLTMCFFYHIADARYGMQPLAHGKSIGHVYYIDPRYDNAALAKAFKRFADGGYPAVTRAIARQHSEKAAKLRLQGKKKSASRQRNG